jgi:Bacterial Ig-like domain (group 3)
MNPIWRLPLWKRTNIGAGGHSFRTGRRRGRTSRMRSEPIVTRLEERTLLTTPTITTLGISAPSLSYGQQEVFTATVTTDPPSAVTATGGTVSFMEGSTTLGSATLTNGTAQFGTTALGAGIHVVTAVYSGTGEFGGSSTAGTPTSVINTVAGGGVGDGGPATAASLFPTDVAVGADGNIFINGRGLIREVNHITGVITTVVAGGDSGIAVDGSGHLYFAEPFSHRVRAVDLSTGKITTVAGYGGSAYSGDGGPATAAGLGDPNSLAVDAHGHLYIADWSHNVIRAVDLTTGVITTVAGNGHGGYSGDGGPATAAALQ